MVTCGEASSSIITSIWWQESQFTLVDDPFEEGPVPRGVQHSAYHGCTLRSPVLVCGVCEACWRHVVHALHLWHVVLWRVWA